MILLNLTDGCRARKKQIKQNNNAAVAAEREPEMAYKKPEIVAKSTVQHSYVAGCPAKQPNGTGNIKVGDYGCRRCEMSGR